MYEPPKCKRCNKVISFVVTKRGKQMPVDGFSEPIIPYVRGSVYYTERGEQIRGYRVARGTKGAVNVLVPHWYTCPFADENRKPKPDRRREAIRAQVEREREEARHREERRAEKAAREAEALEAERAQLCMFGGVG